MCGPIFGLRLATFGDERGVVLVSQQYGQRRRGAFGEQSLLTAFDELDEDVSFTAVILPSPNNDSDR